MPRKGYKRVTDPDTGRIRYLPPQHPLVQAMSEEERTYTPSVLKRMREGERGTPPKRNEKRNPPADIHERVFRLAESYANWTDIGALLGVSRKVMLRWRTEDPGIEIAYNRARANRVAPVDDNMLAKARDPDDAQAVQAAKEVYKRFYPEEREQQGPLVNVNVSVLPTPGDDIPVTIDARPEFDRGTEPERPDPFRTLRKDRT